MDMFSKKPSSQETVTKDTTDGELPHPVDTTTQTTAPVVKKEKHSRAFSFVSMLFLLAILGVGVMAYLWYDQKSTVDSMQAEVDAAEATVTNLRTQLGKANSSDPNGSISSGPLQQSDDDLIKQAVIAYNHAYVAAEKTQYTVNVTKKESVFAWASFGTVPPEGGAKCLLKKVDGLWVILYCGQDVMPQAELDKWGVPKGF
jgi:hypothetical protein